MINTGRETVTKAKQRYEWYTRVVVYMYFNCD